MARLGSIVKACERCGEPFRHKPCEEGKARFCSCLCRALTLSPLNAAQRGDKRRGCGDGKAYRKRGGRHEHRVVAEKKIGRPLLPGEIVHHKDEDILNNHPDNLEVMSRRQHMIVHGIGLPGVTPRRYLKDKALKNVHPR